MTTAIEKRLCLVGQTLESLSKDQSELLNKKINDYSEWSAQRLHVALRKIDPPIQIGATTLKIHRRKECGCFL